MDFMTIVLLLIGLAFVVYQYWRKRCHYWIDKGVPCLRPRFPFGDTKELVLRKIFIGHFTQKIYNDFPNAKCVGIINIAKPELMIKDPDIIKQVMTKDFKYFTDRVKLLLDEKEEPLNHHLFNMSGAKWRNMRVKLTPTFTSGKMKIMFYLMKSCADSLGDRIYKLAEKNQEINVTDFMARYTTDVIGTCGFGLDINSIENPNSEFRKMGQRLFTTTRYQIFRTIIRFIVPRIVKLLKLKMIHKEIEEFFTGVVRDTIEFREKNKIQRNDFLDLLIQIKNNGSLESQDSNQLDNKSKVG